MARQFRLLQVCANFGPRGLPLFSEGERELDVAFSPKRLHPDLHPFVSVVIGKNGVGKSRLLARIAGTFEDLDRNKSHRHPRDLTVARLVYQCDGHVCELSFDHEGAPTARMDRRPCEIKDVPLPSKVIALTTTPFDKFRLPESLLRQSRFFSQQQQPMPADRPERYVYLGLREARNSLSPISVIFRSIDGLFEASHFEAGRRMRVAEVFGFLGYEPSLQVLYEVAFDRGHWIRDIANGNFPRPSKGSRSSRDPPPQLLQMLEREPALSQALQVACREMLNRSERNQINLRADFEYQSDYDPFFQKLQLLRRARLIRLRAANLRRVVDGEVIDMTRASSGELGIVTSFLGLASVIEDGSLVFVDEPEISLHPEWQMQYIDLLLKTFGNFGGCHFVLATHSPLILSDISPKNSTLVSLDVRQRDLEPTTQLAGKSPDQVLVAAFRSPGRNNLYVKQEIVKALRLAADGQIATEEFQTTLKRLVDLLPEMEHGSPASKLIRELKSTGETSTANE
jgi:predicted ATPase